MPILMRRILIATDFNPAAKRALDYAHELANQFGAELHILHVVLEPLPVPGPDGALIRPVESVATLIQKAERGLNAIVKDLPLDTGSKPVCAVEVGHPVEQILKYAANNQIDLIAVGTHGHRGLSRLLLGSVAEKIVRTATCPVLTVHTSDQQ